MVRVYFEVGKAWVFACAVDYPGWQRRAKGEEAALETLEDYRSRYGDAVGSAPVRGTHPNPRMSATTPPLVPAAPCASARHTQPFPTRGPRVKGVSDEMAADRARPNRRYNAGKTNRLSSVAVIRPPKMTMAIGCSIS